MPSFKFVRYEVCSIKINHAIGEMAALFPQVNFTNILNYDTVIGV